MENIKMKKIICLILCFAMSLTLCACSFDYFVDGVKIGTKKEVIEEKCLQGVYDSTKMHELAESALLNYCNIYDLFMKGYYGKFNGMEGEVFFTYDENDKVDGMYFFYYGSDYSSFYDDARQYFENIHFGKDGKMKEDSCCLVSEEQVYSCGIDKTVWYDVAVVKFRGRDDILTGAPSFGGFTMIKVTG